MISDAFENSNRQYFKNYIFNFQIQIIDKKNCICRNLEKLVEKSKILDKLKLVDQSKYAEELSLAITRLEFILSKKSEDLINIFRLNSEEGQQDFELAILRAFLNCKC